MVKKPFQLQKRLKNNPKIQKFLMKIFLDIVGVITTSKLSILTHRLGLKVKVRVKTTQQYKSLKLPILQLCDKTENFLSCSLSHIFLVDVETYSIKNGIQNLFFFI